MYKRFTEGDACEDKGDRRRVIRESLWTVTQVSPLWEWRGKEAWVGRVSDCCIILRKSQSGHWEVPEPKLFFRGLLCLAETQCSLWTPLHALSSTYIHLHTPHLVCLSRNPSRGSLLFPSHVLHCLFLFSPSPSSLMSPLAPVLQPCQQEVTTGLWNSTMGAGNYKFRMAAACLR